MRWSAPDGRTALWFSYLSISLPAMPREQVLALHRPELWPLVLLAKEPVDRILVSEMLTDVVEQNLHDMLPLIHTAASWQMEGDDLIWLSQEYHKMFELFRETPAYQWMKHDATEEARREERVRAQEEIVRTQEEMARAQEEMARAKEEMARQRKQEQRMMLLELRRMVMELAAMRFPELAQLTQTVTRKLTRPEAFRYLLVRLFQARDAAEAQKTLQTTLDEEGEANLETQDELA